jgi:hypothetical protein
MKLAVNLVAGGRYIRAGEPLPPDFELPPHLEQFAIGGDDAPQISQADSRLASGDPGLFGAGGRLAKPAVDRGGAISGLFPAGEERFIPDDDDEPQPTRGRELGERIRKAHQNQKKGKS